MNFVLRNHVFLQNKNRLGEIPKAGANYITQILRFYFIGKIILKTGFYEAGGTSTG
jgi:hypothetical protein